MIRDIIWRSGVLFAYKSYFCEYISQYSRYIARSSQLRTSCHISVKSLANEPRFLVGLYLNQSLKMNSSSRIVDTGVLSHHSLALTMSAPLLFLLVSCVFPEPANINYPRFRTEPVEAT